MAVFNLTHPLHRAFVQYNEDSFTPAQVDGAKVLITSHGRQPDGRYVDPKSKQTFSFDHLRKEVSDLEVRQCSLCSSRPINWTQRRANHLVANCSVFDVARQQDRRAMKPFAQQSRQRLLNTLANTITAAPQRYAPPDDTQWACPPSCL
jgi:hypothetical protein